MFSEARLAEFGALGFGTLWMEALEFGALGFGAPAGIVRSWVLSASAARRLPHEWSWQARLTAV